MVSPMITAKVTVTVIAKVMTAAVVMLFRKSGGFGKRNIPMVWVKLFETKLICLNPRRSVD
ncbi:MAG: hypothetical protein ACD_10C00304G0001 [uncultured bacterium]|nr:MAG: hypothetical protein ACD_10C00304G0001 [uncultured bacterium]